MHFVAKEIGRYTISVETQNFVSPQDDIFAYQNGSDIIVNGEGELQVFDVMGRIIMQKHVNGVEMVRKPSKSGVYIFRLNGKTQKIVIR